MVLLAIRHIVTARVRGRIVLVGDAMGGEEGRGGGRREEGGGWKRVGIVKFCVKAWKTNDIAKELSPLGHEIVEEVHLWSEANTLADAMSRVAETGKVPEGLLQRTAPVPRRV